MDDTEAKLLDETKKSLTNQPAENTDTTPKKDGEVDVDALLKLHGLSSETQNPTNKKWVALAILTVVIIVFMVVISLMLNNLSK